MRQLNQPRRQEVTHQRRASDGEVDAFLAADNATAHDTGVGAMRTEEAVHIDDPDPTTVSGRHLTQECVPSVHPHGVALGPRATVWSFPRRVVGRSHEGDGCAAGGEGVETLVELPFEESVNTGSPRCIHCPA